jgi:hypothetical protein
VQHLFQQEAIERQIKSALIDPRLKHRHPQTASQEIGWYSQPLMETRESKGLVQSEVTNYQERYIKMAAVNPFSKQVYSRR